MECQHNYLDGKGAKMLFTVCERAGEVTEQSKSYQTKGLL